jgi:glycosyltransferase involved in cell wall biosynthesis
MNKLNIVWLSDLDLRGSGYANISAPVCSGLIERGHGVKVIGLGYNNEEHSFPFSLLPAQNIQEATGCAINLQKVWDADIIVVALDIPWQERIITSPYLQDMTMKYMGIFPIEAEPLCFSWATILMRMDKSMVISEFGTEEAKRIGIDSDYLQVGIDTEAWKQVEQEEKTKLRRGFGFTEEEFVVLTVADNQERKNLVAAMDMFAEFAKDKPNARYVMVTREHNQVGWKLRDYAQEIGINDKLMLLERGIPHKELWVTYAISDVFLLTSKAEGLGMPLMEAMAVGLPCIATNCTGMAELLAGGRGWLVDYKDCCTHRDPFGNGKRYWIDTDDGIEALERIYMRSPSKLVVYKNPDIRDTVANTGDPQDLKQILIPARKYVETRTWDIAIDQVEKAILEVCGE